MITRTHPEGVQSATAASRSPDRATPVQRTACSSLARTLIAAGAAAAMACSASAADLGGDCCADLEERIAELEATTARKGNRKVSLRVTGQINQAIMGWDDGEEQNVYQVANSHSSSRFGFNGSAKINKDLEAGYLLDVTVRTASSSSVDQLSDEGSGSGLRLRNSVWYLRSESLGTMSVGLAAPATDDIIAYNLGGTNVAASSDVTAAGGGLFTRDSSIAGGGGLNSLSSGNTMSLRWRRFGPELDTPQSNLVRYDSPLFMGFAVSAAWGRDDFWDVALRYAKDTKEFRFAAGIGFHENRTEDDDTFGWPPGGDGEPNNGGTVVREYKGSASLLHIPSGLFVSGAYVHREFSGLDPGVLTFACFTSADAQGVRDAGITCDNRPDFDYYWINAGIRRNFFGFGWTSIYGEYSRSMDAVTGLNVSVASAVGGDIDYVTSSTMEMWGAGIVQHIAAAQMDIYFTYRHFSADVRGIESDGTAVVAPLEDASVFLAGSRIRF